VLLSTVSLLNKIHYLIAWIITFNKYTAVNVLEPPFNDLLLGFKYLNDISTGSRPNKRTQPLLMM
jgi:hypothetical protein